MRIRQQPICMTYIRTEFLGPGFLGVWVCGDLGRGSSCAMTVQELKDKVESYRGAMKAKSGKVMVASEAGPVGLGVINAVVAVLEAHEKRIEELEGKRSS